MHSKLYFLVRFAPELCSKKGENSQLIRRLQGDVNICEALHQVAPSSHRKRFFRTIVPLTA